ncbi:MAG: hypothetical protein HOP07_11460 [Bacteriovoracaceae bacterium]|nr:hypothetical protein [Bacteriovoracaceae bacterium]
MKSLFLCSLLLTLSSNLLASEESRSYKKISSTEAVVTIKTEETDGTQAATYVDAKETEQFINDLLKDPSSPLAKLVKEIELQNCEATSTPDQTWIDGCGEVTLTAQVRTGFGRGGWASAGAAYTFFVGFTSDGTGRFFDVSHMITISESADAQTNDQYDYSGVVLKTLSLIEVKKLEK